MILNVITGRKQGIVSRAAENARKKIAFSGWTAAAVRIQTDARYNDFMN